ncbi:major surface protease gp63, putative [Leishmania tarentolae]|uniref:Major surface protease gp63, putative n=1 Tax=Leishmania tarentolae TaxID=5689 RepID=A0A640KXT4_LEITA|nr:major surface protease gp63, putative [Leishmania tarentolae]
MGCGGPPAASSQSRSKTAGAIHHVAIVLDRLQVALAHLHVRRARDVAASSEGVAHTSQIHSKARRAVNVAAAAAHLHAVRARGRVTPHVGAQASVRPYLGVTDLRHEVPINAARRVGEDVEGIQGIHCGRGTLRAAAIFGGQHSRAVVHEVEHSTKRRIREVLPIGRKRSLLCPCKTSTQPQPVCRAAHRVLKVVAEHLRPLRGALLHALLAEEGATRVLAPRHHLGLAVVRLVEAEVLEDGHGHGSVVPGTEAAAMSSSCALRILMCDTAELAPPWSSSSRCSKVSQP